MLAGEEPHIDINTLSPNISAVVAPDWCRICKILIFDQVSCRYKMGGWTATYYPTSNSFPVKYAHCHYSTIKFLVESASSGALCAEIWRSLRIHHQPSSSYRLLHTGNDPTALLIQVKRKEQEQERGGRMVKRQTIRHIADFRLVAILEVFGLAFVTSSHSEIHG